MSCRLKNSNSNRRMERSATDRYMMEKFNPLRENYESPIGFGAGPNMRSSADMKLQKQWCKSCKNWVTLENYHPGIGWDNYPTQRTNFDKELQSKWCPKCNSCVENYVGPVWVGPRTVFDKELQSKWCPTCPPSNTQENFSDYLQSFNDTDNVYSYGPYLN